MTGPGLSRHAEPVAFDQPLLVVTPPELPKGVGELRDRGEMPHPQQVLLQGTNEPFGNAIALGLPHEARRAGHPQECQLPLEVMAHVGAAVIVADRWPGGDPLIRAARGVLGSNCTFESTRIGSTGASLLVRGRRVGGYPRVIARIHSSIARLGVRVLCRRLNRFAVGQRLCPWSVRDSLRPPEPSLTRPASLLRRRLPPRPPTPSPAPLPDHGGGGRTSRPVPSPREGSRP